MQDLQLRAFGHLGNDAEIRHHNNDTAISFSLATNETWNDAQGQKHSRTTWLRCTIWRKQNQSTKIAEYLKKGERVYVEGFPSISQFTTRDGQPGANLELRISDLKLLGSGSNQPQQQSPQHQQAAAPATVGANDEPDDLPF